MQFARKYIWFTNLELHSKVSDIPYHILERLAWLQCHEVLTTFSNGRMLVFWMQNSCSWKTLAHAFLCCSSETPPTSKIQHFLLTQASSGRGNNSILKHWPNCCLPSTCWWFKQTKKCGQQLLARSLITVLCFAHPMPWNTCTSWAGWQDSV